jgi:hypothetical protein
MSYTTVSRCVNDPAFVSRINACVAQEQLAKGDEVQPGAVAMGLVWAVASESDVEDAYASALAANNPDPGGDEAVITDGMILSHVQANWPAGPAAE